MTPEEYIKQFNQFTDQAQQEIMSALMSDFCETMMSNPAQMQNIMQKCSQMMEGSSMPKNWGMPSFEKGGDQ